MKSKKKRVFLLFSPFFLFLEFNLSLYQFFERRKRNGSHFSQFVEREKGNREGERETESQQGKKTENSERMFS